MAILIQEEKKSINIFPVLIVLLIVGVISFGIYALFFAPTPGIEVVLPGELQSAERISSIDVDPSTVINSREFRTLRSYAGPASVGSLGRDNPFANF